MTEQSKDIEKAILDTDIELLELFQKRHELMLDKPASFNMTDHFKRLEQVAGDLGSREGMEALLNLTAEAKGKPLCWCQGLPKPRTLLWEWATYR
ncbi:hypothetical protein [Salinicoccus sp. CNSTN-B1]